METLLRSRMMLLLLVLAVAVGCARAQSGFAGDSCKTDKGVTGICRVISNCPEARAALLKGEQPSICSYEQFTPIVCCPAQSKALRMCEKYAEAVYRYEKTFHIPPQTVKIDQCATKGLPFIAGGEKAISNEFPHMALIGYGNKREAPEWSCGGSLVSNRFVLTAAHCLEIAIGSPRWVRLGELNLKNNNELNVHVDYAVTERIPHPEYKDSIFYNDIALLKLDRDVEFTASIRPVCLHAVAEISDKDAVASGWGYTDWATPEITDHLMKVKLPFHKTEVCQNAYKTLSTTPRLRRGIVEESMVCAGTLEGGKDTCRGDSGGPLQVKPTKPYCMYSLVGVTSFGKGNCGTTNSPAIYTRVSFFLPWIEPIIWANEK